MARERTSALPLIVCADLGNSRIHLALFRGSRVLRARALDYDRFRRSGAADILRRRGVESVCYASVVPSREREFERRARVSRILKLGRDLPVPVRVRSGSAWRPGVDRMCNALAAYTRFGGACICVDVGSALNLEVVSRRGDLVAGIIAPGPD
ncbi:MAG TPA: type III pantothenate kinase, partial [Planctomycetota bacterium]|nr:type III pantothenate kinase [Planctomycetota bacterium]